MRSVWNGQVTFGLVTIPVRLYAATSRGGIRLRQVHAADAGRIHYQRVCSVDGEEVPYSEIAKGYESDGETVVLTDEELSAAESPSASSNAKTAEVVEFVPLESIDPIYFDKSYYLEPGKEAVRPYVLLRDALHKSGRVAIMRITLRNRESMAVLRVTSDVIVASTLLWSDEVRSPDFPFLDEDAPSAGDREMSMAHSLIDAMAEDHFDPARFHDSYREAVERLVEDKLQGKQTVPGPDGSASREGGEADSDDASGLLRALSTSVDEAGGDGTGGRRDNRSQKRSGTSGSRSAGRSTKGGTTAKSSSRKSAKESRTAQKSKKESA